LGELRIRGEGDKEDKGDKKMCHIVSTLQQEMLSLYPGLLIENELSRTAKLRNDKTLFLRGF